MTASRTFTRSAPPELTVRAPAWAVAIAFAGAASALVGGYWDDAWHTERGRDEFLIAPHIAIYAGVALAGAALSLWALVAARCDGPSAVWRHKPLALGLLSVAVTLASGPVDNLWHVAFGRDAVVWSPPHMLGLAGMLAIAASLLAELASRPGGWSVALSVVAGALVIAPAAFATVEYDTDVPQFAALWYLPMLGLTSAIAFAMVRLASPLRWATAASASVYTLFIVATGAFLWVLGFPPPALPLLIAPALAVDVATLRRWPSSLTALAFAGVLYAAYVPVRNWLGDGVQLDLADVGLGLPLTALASWVVFAIAAGRRPSKPAAATTALVAVLALPGAALAHDPGQGEDAGTADLAVWLNGDRANLSAELAPGPCSRTSPSAIVARRGGETLRAPLEKVGCRFNGELQLLERGRWFIYAEMLRDGRVIETWLPISLKTGPQRVAEQDRYVYFPPERSGGPVQVLAGIVLYGGMLGLFIAAFSLIRRASPAPA